MFASQRELSQEALAEQRDIRLAQDAEGLARALDVLGLAEMPDYRAAMASLQIPITLMTGSHDSKFSGIARALARRTLTSMQSWSTAWGTTSFSRPRPPSPLS